MERTEMREPGASEYKIEVPVRVLDELGLHARPAAKLAQAALQFEAEIQLLTSDASADAKSILDILSLSATKGTNVTIRCTGPDATEAAKAISTLFFQD